ncbi:MAG: hypothetical protein GVY20_05040 [Bacteroidetes bacterium]|jgi:hypothetical protein|nr:hypothetical protein [Bacteroidota bacterium]
MKKSRVIFTAVAPFLFLLEYLLKFSAGVISLIVMGDPGSFLGKLGSGYGSLLNVYEKIAEWPGDLVYIGSIINDYNTLTASAFNQRYGGDALNSVMDALNNGVVYFQAVYRNLSYDPFSTIAATTIAFLSFYISARACRFIRQKGQGSYIVQKERQLGDRIFRKNN